MIKKILITALITIGLGISQSFAIQGYTVNVGESTTSQINNRYKMLVATNGMYQTIYGGEQKNILSFDNGNYFFRTNEQKPYISTMGDHATDLQRHAEGYINNFLLCDELTGTAPENCENQSFDENSNMFYRIAKTSNKRYYGKFTESRQSYPEMKGSLFCFSSSENEISVCIYACGRTDCNSIAEQIGGVQPYMNLSNSQNFGINFNNIPNNKIGYMPNTYNGNQNGNNVPYCPTIGQLMKNMGENYNINLCYNSTLVYSGGTVQTIDKKDIFTVFNNYEEYTQRINLYRNNCNTPATQQNCQNAFNGEFEKYSIISNAINAGVDEKKLWNYCNMGLNYDPNATTCVASGYIAEQPTVEELIDEIANGDFTIARPGTGTVYDGLFEQEQGYNPLDVRGNIDRIYGKITGMFEGREGKNGIIPDIILWFGFAIILFTVLFKW